MCMNRNRQESNYEVLNPYSPHGQVEGNEGNQVSATVPQPSAGSSAQPSPAQPSAGCSAQLSAERGIESSFVKTNKQLGIQKLTKLFQILTWEGLLFKTSNVKLVRKKNLDMAAQGLKFMFLGKVSVIGYLFNKLSL